MPLTGACLLMLQIKAAISAVLANFLSALQLAIPSLPFYVTTLARLLSFLEAVILSSYVLYMDICVPIG